MAIANIEVPAIPVGVWGAHEEGLVAGTAGEKQKAKMQALACDFI